MINASCISFGRTSHFLYTFLLTVWCVPALLHSQQAPVEKWKKQFGGSRDDNFQMVVETIEGGIAAVGNTASRAYRKNDILLVVTDENGNELVNTNFGGKEDDGANAIVQTFDGGYVIAGFTASPWKGSAGKRDAWLLKVSERGVLIWDKILGTAEDDEFFDVMRMEDGSFVATGHRNNRLYAAAFSKNGDLLREYEGNESPVTGIALAPLPGNCVAIAGNAGKVREKTAFLLKLQLDGLQNVWQKNWQDWNPAAKLGKQMKTVDAAEVYDLVATSGGELVLAGKAKVPTRRDEMFFLKTDSTGALLRFETYGGNGEDGSKALLQTLDGNFLLGGFKTTHPGDSRTDMWLHLVKPDGNGIWKDNDGIVGGSHGDEANSLAQLNNGGLIIAGKEGKLTNAQASLYAFEPAGFPRQNGVPVIRVEQEGFFDENNNGLLEPGERGYYAFTLTNEGTGDAWNISARLDTLALFDGFRTVRNLSAGHLPKQASRQFTIPVSARDNLKSGVNRFRVTFEAWNGVAIPPFVFEVRSRKESAPQLQVTDHQFPLPGGKPIRRKQEFRLDIELKNTGDAPAEDVFFRFSLPDFVEPLDSLTRSLGNLQPGEERKLSLRFKPGPLFQPDTLEVRVRSWESTGEKGLQGSYPLILPDDGDEFSPSVPEPDKRGGNRGPHPAYFQMEDDIEIAWSAPLPAEIGGYTVMPAPPKYQLKLSIKTTQPLSLDSIRLLKNGEPFLPKEKPELTALYENTQILKVPVEFTEGENSLSAKVLSGGKEYSSRTMTFHYQPKKYNLHVYAFGIPSDLQFTTIDARDFANQFRNQDGENGQYKKVFIHEFTSEDNTSEASLKKAMTGIAMNPDILEGDDLVLFFSSHGFISSEEGNHFKLVASDGHNSPYKEDFSLDLKVKVLDKLGRDLPNNRKYLFLDACRSGSVESNYEVKADKDGSDEPQSEAQTETLIEYATAERNNNGFAIMTSCNSGETSFENKAWGHGAFTRALLEAFQGKEFKGTSGPVKGDDDGNGRIDIRELFYFAEERVPALVKEVYPGKKQTPFIPNRHLKEPKAIYKIKSN